MLVSEGKYFISKFLTLAILSRCPDLFSHQLLLPPHTVFTFPSFPPVSPPSTLTHPIKDALTRTTNKHFPASLKNSKFYPARHEEEKSWTISSNSGKMCNSSFGLEYMELSELFLLLIFPLSVASKYKPVFAPSPLEFGHCHSDIHLYFNPKSSSHRVHQQE